MLRGVGLKNFLLAWNVYAEGEILVGSIGFLLSTNSSDGNCCLNINSIPEQDWSITLEKLLNVSVGVDVWNLRVTVFHIAPTS